MKQRYWFALLVVFTICSFVAGRFLQHLQTGYTHIVINESSQDSPFGSVVLRHEFEKEGVLFLDPEFSTIEIKSRDGGKTVVYKAQVGFQEAYPHVKSVRVNEHGLVWDDGLYDYDLRIRAIPQESGVKTTTENSNRP